MSVYRASRHALDAFAPAVGWTRRAALAIALLGAAPSALVVYELLTDHDCDKRSTPHFELVALVVLLALALGAAGVKLQRKIAARIARRHRARSRFRSVALASLAVWPAVLLALANCATAFVIDFAATFKICIDVDPTRAFFPLGC